MRYIINLFFFILIISCADSKQSSYKQKVITYADTIRSGQEIVYSNCSGCHSFKTDVENSKLTLYDLYKMENLKLRLAISRLNEDSIHVDKIKILRSDEKDSVYIYIKAFYDIKSKL